MVGQVIPTGAGGVIQETALPVSAIDVTEFANVAGFPAIGNAGTLYIAIDVNKIFRFNTATQTYIEVPTAGAALAEVTDLIIQDEVNTSTSYVSGRKFWVGITKLLSGARTWALKQTFTSAPQFDTTTINQVLEVNATKELISAAKNSAYNKNFAVNGATTSGTVVSADDIRVPKINQTAITNPTVTDDSVVGYSVNSLWLNTVSGQWFIAVSVVTGVAVWKRTDNPEFSTQAEAEAGTNSTTVMSPLRSQNFWNKVKTLVQDIANTWSFTGLIVKDAIDPQKQLKITLPVDIPSTGVPQEKQYIIRENIPDYLKDSAPQTSSFTAAWGFENRIDADAGNVVVTIPASVSSNNTLSIQLHRRDNSANEITVLADRNQYFFQLLGNIKVHAFTMKTGSSVNIRSIGTAPVITEYNGIAKAQRLWLPTDASVSPVVWYSIRDLASLVLSGSNITAINNKGTLGAGWNLTINGTPAVLVSNTFANFLGGAYRNGVSQPTMATSNLSFVAMYQQNTAAANFLFSQNALASRFSLHPKWNDFNTNTYVDMPLVSRIFADLGATVIGVNPHIALGRKGANREYYVDGNQTPSIFASGGGTALGGSSLFALGADTDFSAPFIGGIYEILFYNIEITNDERDRVSAYMAWATNQQGQLHASNPYKATPPLKTLRIF